MIGKLANVGESFGVNTGGLKYAGYFTMTKVITFGLILCLIGVFSISSCSIGMQCMNSNNGSYMKDHSKSYKFMIFTLIMSLILLLLGIGIIVARIVTKVYTRM